MKRYAILAGGGVKGVALAGCLAASQEKGIEFEGYGGTSAGSIVALLASVHYSGRDIGTLMADESFTTFLDDNGKELNRVQRLIGGVFNGLSVTTVAKTGYRLYRERTLLKKLYERSGLYGANNLERFLLDNVRRRYQNLADGFDFRDLSNAGGKPLKIVAADVVSRRSVVFANDQGGDTFDWSVIGAVRASTSYPFVFQPVKLHNNYLADGGISSNLPVFLFEKERRNNGLPILAFDLIATSEQRPISEYRLFDFCRDLLATSMESSDKLLQGLVSGLHYIPVKIPSGIDTLKFSLTKDEQTALFNAGYEAAAAYLEKEVKHWFQSSGDRIKELQAQQRTRPETVEGVLGVVAKECESVTRASKIRCSIMLPTGGDNQIVVYQYGLSGHSDVTFEIDLSVGWSGKARLQRRVIVADLAQGPEILQKEWKFTPAQCAKIPQDRKAVLCLPLFDVSNSVDGKIDADKDRLLGTLCIDTATPLNETGWGSISATVGRTFDLDEAMRSRCLLWGEVLSRLLS